MTGADDGELVIGAAVPEGLGEIEGVAQYRHLDHRKAPSAFDHRQELGRRQHLVALRMGVRARPLLSHDRQETIRERGVERALGRDAICLQGQQVGGVPHAP